MGIWQIIMIIIFSMNFGINLVKHGERKDGEYNAWAALISIGIDVFILYKGGFF